MSVNSKPDHPPWATTGDSHILVAPGVGFSLLCPGVLNQSKSSIILKKSAVFALSLKQMGSSSFHMFINARSEQCGSGPIYTITNTQCIRIYPGKLKFILVKISPDPGRLHGKHVIENQTLFTIFIIENLSGLPCSQECNYLFRFVQLSSMAIGGTRPFSNFSTLLLCWPSRMDIYCCLGLANGGKTLKEKTLIV